MQAVSVIGILCCDGRSPADIRLSIQEAVAEGRLVSLNLSSCADAVQTLHSIITLRSTHQQLGEAADGRSLQQETCSEPSVSRDAIASFSSTSTGSRAGTARDPRRRAESEHESPPLSPRHSFCSVISDVELSCAPADTLAVAAGCKDCSTTAISPPDIPSKESNSVSASPEQAPLHDAYSGESTEFTDISHALVALNLSGLALDASSLKSASTLLSAINLQTFILDGCGIDDNSALTLASNLSCYSALRTLNIRHNAITDAGAKSLLLAARCHPKLQTIVCDGCRVSVRLQKMLWDISKRNSVAGVAPTARTAVPVSPSGRAQRRRAVGPAALTPSQRVSADDRLPRRASSFVSFIACRTTASGHSVDPTATASAPASPVVLSAVPQRFSTPVATRRSLARQFALDIPRPSRSESDDDSECINQFIQIRHYTSSLDRCSTVPEASPSHGRNSNCDVSFDIDDLLHACAVMQNRAGIPVPLHFSRTTPSHEIRAFMRREQLKREKTSPAKLLRNHKTPPVAPSTQLSPSSSSPAVVPKKFKAARSISGNENIRNSTSTSATLLSREELHDEQQWSHICAVGVSSSDMTPSVVSALTEILPFTDFEVGDCVSDDHVDGGACDGTHAAAPRPSDNCSTSMQRIDFPPPCTSVPLSSSANRTFSSQQTTNHSSHSPSHHCATTEPPLPQLLNAPLQLEVLPLVQERQAVSEFDCIMDDSSLWAKNAAIMIRTALQGTP